MIDRATCIVQARMGSARLPGKSLELIGGVAVVEIVLRRLAKAHRLARVVLATSVEPRDDALAAHAARQGFPVFRGSETDLIARYLGCARRYADSPYLVRATGDNVFMDWDEVDRVVGFGINGGYDFVGFQNAAHPDRMNDFAAEFLRRDALERVDPLARTAHEREHVFPYFHAHPDTFRVTCIEVAPRLHTKAKLDLDYPEDLARLRRIAAEIDDPISVPAARVVEIANRIFASLPSLAAIDP